jgi:Uma2 family endonuclease
MIAAMLAASFSNRDDAPTEDGIVALRGATWADYRRVVELKGDARVPRVAYLEGVLELMTPSRSHESLTSWIGRLVEVWCFENDIEFSPLGAWTLEEESEDRAIEPDECYIFGDNPADVPRPDLAIEVIWTSGGLDKLDIYRKIGVREVWIWRRGHLKAYSLRGDAYVEVANSEVLPGIDLDELVSFVDRPTASKAIRDYRAALQARRK